MIKKKAQGLDMVPFLFFVLVIFSNLLLGHISKFKSMPFLVGYPKVKINLYFISRRLTMCTPGGTDGRSGAMRRGYQTPGGGRAKDGVVL